MRALTALPEQPQGDSQSCIKDLIPSSGMPTYKQTEHSYMQQEGLPAYWGTA